ncbi:MAG: hypothetical protein KJZ85_06470 [Rhodobacteraceae bacterium]|jgi:hypothetical protein|nr:hypothetical protein [Paracoccaceae bacterium]
MRLRTEGLRRGSLALAMAVLLPAAAGAADLIDHIFPPKPSSEATVCDPPAVGRFTLTGPGRLTVRTSLLNVTFWEFIRPQVSRFDARQVAPRETEWDIQYRALGAMLDSYQWGRYSPTTPPVAGNEAPQGMHGLPHVEEHTWQFRAPGPLSIEISANTPCERRWPLTQQHAQRMRVELFADEGATLRIDAAAGNNLAAAPADLQVLWNTANPQAVANGPTRWTEVVVERAFRLVRLTTYHWNGGRGQAPGMIALAGLDGRIHGPWAAQGAPGQGGVPNAYWIVEPDIRLPAGRYIVIDSDPATWAQNAGTGGAGMTWAEGRPD